MTTSYIPASVTWQSDTAAKIQAWAGAILALLSAGSWAQASDTGQTAVGSLPACTTSNQVSGYQIWHTTDSLHVVYVKFEFGSGNTSTNPGLWITIGTGSDGAGNITGTLLARTANLSMGGSATATFLGSCGPSYLNFYLGAGSHFLFCLERTRDTSGAETGDGINLIWDPTGSTSSNPVYYRVVHFSGNQPPNSTSWGLFFPSDSTWARGTDVGVCPARFFDGMPSNPALCAVGYMRADLPSLASFSVQQYGVAHTYFALGASLIASFQGINTTNASLALRYE